MLNRVFIPPGCEDGQVFKFSLDEETLKRCTKGQEKHFYVYATVAADDELRREGKHVYSDANASLSQVLLGGKIKVKGLKRDELRLEIPPLHDLVSALHYIISCESSYTYLRSVVILLGGWQERLHGRRPMPLLAPRLEIPSWHASSEGSIVSWDGTMMRWNKGGFTSTKSFVGSVFRWDGLVALNFGL